MSRFYCDKCKGEVETRLIKRKEVFPVRSEDTKVQSTVRICRACGSDIYDRGLDSANLEAAYDAYRRKHGILAPSEICNLREKYGLSQRSLSALLGWGEVTIHRYENGSLPDEAHSRLLQLLGDPENMWRLYEKMGDRLPAQYRLRLREKLDEFRAREAPTKVLSLLDIMSRRVSPGLENGNRPFSMEAMRGMIGFFATGRKGVFKTKLNKLLWYADFTHFRLHSVSISGATYVHLPFGPVPDQFQWHLSSAIEVGLIESREVKFPSGHTGELLVAIEEVDMSVFDSVETDVLVATREYFKDLGSLELSNLSHKERGYKETPQGEVISYEYADRMKVRMPIRPRQKRSIN